MFKLETRCIASTKKSKSINKDHQTVIKLSHHRSSERMFRPERRCTASPKNQPASTIIMKPWRPCTASTKNQKSSTKIKKNHQNECLSLKSVALHQQTIKKHQQILLKSYHHQRKLPPKLFQLKKRWLQKNSAENLLGRSSTCLAGTLHQNIMH